MDQSVTVGGENRRLSGSGTVGGPDVPRNLLKRFRSVLYLRKALYGFYFCGFGSSRGLPADSAGSRFTGNPFVSVDTDLSMGADSTGSMCCLVISVGLTENLVCFFLFLSVFQVFDRIKSFEKITSTMT